MTRRGYIGKKESDFLKQGVIFETLKLALYGMRPDEIRERTYLIKTGQYDKIRPSSGQSRMSKMSDNGPPKTTSMDTKRKTMQPEPNPLPVIKDPNSKSVITLNKIELSKLDKQIEKLAPIPDPTTERKRQTSLGFMSKA